MKFVGNYHGETYVEERFALFPYTLPDSKNEYRETTVWLQKYKVFGRYRTSSSLLSFLLGDDNFTRYLVKEDKWFV